MSHHTIQHRWESVQERVLGVLNKCGRKEHEVRIIAVSKKCPVERIAEAVKAGVRLLGENYVQEALPKMEALPALLGDSNVKTEWHFIGALQSNKAKQVVGKFSLVHSLDRWSLAQALDKVSKTKGVSVKALIEVNAAGEASKAGMPIFDVKPFVERISRETQIEIEGLMTFPPLTERPDESRPYFAKVKGLADELRSADLPRVSMKELSMGVTSDFEAAIEEGATLVRIGTAIFGPRPV